MEEQRLLNIKQASKILGIKPKTLYQWKWLKLHLSFVKVGKSLRIREEELMRFIKDNTIEPGKVIPGKSMRKAIGQTLNR